MHLMRKHCANAGFRFNIHTMQATEEPEKLRVQLEALTIEHRDLAIAALSCIPESEFRRNLLAIADLTVDRQA